LETDVCFEAKETAQSEQVADFFMYVAQLYQQKGYHTLKIHLDNSSTHKKKMKAKLEELTKDLTIQIQFCHLPPYSPKLNLVEYAIHLVRQKITHNADCTIDLQDIEKQITVLTKSPILDKKQIINTLQHIEDLLPKMKTYQ
jgi:transposase